MFKSLGEDRFWFHTINEKKGKRMFATWNLDNQHFNKRVETGLEVYWKRTNPGFQIHFGSTYSEKPLKIRASFWLFSFYWGLYFPGLGAFCQKIGRGHKRNIGLDFHDGSVWWELWYDDDMGYDDHHKCDGWRRPKLWPWSMGRDKYRPWMCLRRGNFDLNPLDAIWGTRYYHYETIDEDSGVLRMMQFPGDSYPVHLKLQEVWRARRHGSGWVSRETFEDWSVAWEAPGSGIPVRNHDWKGDGIIASSEKITSPENWAQVGLASLKVRVMKDRERYNYRPTVMWFKADGLPDGEVFSWKDLSGGA